MYGQGELDDESLTSEIGLNKIQCRKVRAMLKASTKSADETPKKPRDDRSSSKTASSAKASMSSAFSTSSALQVADSVVICLPLPNVWARSLAARSTDDPLLPENAHSSGREKTKKSSSARAKESATENEDNENPTAIDIASAKTTTRSSSSESASSVLSPPPRVRVTSRSGWSEQRLGQRIDAPLDCVLAVASAVALTEASSNSNTSCSRSGSSSGSGGGAMSRRREKGTSRGTKESASPLAGSLLEDRAGAFGAVQHAVRKLRSCWVNAGEAAAVGLELRRLQRVLPHTAYLACCATSAAQALLLEAVLQLLAANDSSSGGSSSSQPVLAAVPIRVVPRDMAALGVSPDVLLVSFTHTAPNQSGGSGQGRRGGGGRTSGSSRAAVARSVEAVSG